MDSNLVHFLRSVSLIKSKAKDFLDDLAASLAQLGHTAKIKTVETFALYSPDKGGYWSESKSNISLGVWDSTPRVYSRLKEALKLADHIMRRNRDWAARPLQGGLGPYAGPKSIQVIRLVQLHAEVVYET